MASAILPWLYRSKFPSYSPAWACQSRARPSHHVWLVMVMCVQNHCNMDQLAVAQFKGFGNMAHTTKIFFKVIDCTEFGIECPSSLVTQATTFSSYKNKNMVKELIGIISNRAVVFVSPTYEIALVRASVCVCVCPPPRPLITSGVI